MQLLLYRIVLPLNFWWFIHYNNYNWYVMWLMRKTCTAKIFNYWGRKPKRMLFMVQFIIMWKTSSLSTKSNQISLIFYSATFLFYLSLIDPVYFKVGKPLLCEMLFVHLFIHPKICVQDLSVPKMFVPNLKCFICLAIWNLHEKWLFPTFFVMSRVNFLSDPGARFLKN